MLPLAVTSPQNRKERVMKQYVVNWAQKNGAKITNQVFTAEHISELLKELEKWEVTDVEIRNIKEDEND